MTPQNFLKTKQLRNDFFIHFWRYFFKKMNIDYLAYFPPSSQNLLILCLSSTVLIFAIFILLTESGNYWAPNLLQKNYKEASRFFLLFHPSPQYHKSFKKSRRRFFFISTKPNVDNFVEQTVSQSATANLKVKLFIAIRINSYSWCGFSIYLLLVFICLTWFKMVKVKVIGFYLLGKI